MMLPLPEDEVAVQLQKLVDQCRHGNNYCKQVISLYQLSKVSNRLPSGDLITFLQNRLLCSFLYKTV